MSARKSIHIDGLSHLTRHSGRDAHRTVADVERDCTVQSRHAQGAEGYPAQYANIFRHVGEMLKAAGGDWRHVAKMEFWAPVPEARDACEAPWNEKFPDANSRPARHTHVVPDSKAVSASFIAYIQD